MSGWARCRSTWRVASCCRPAALFPAPRAEAQDRADGLQPASYVSLQARDSGADLAAAAACSCISGQRRLHGRRGCIQEGKETDARSDFFPLHWHPFPWSCSAG